MLLKTATLATLEIIQGVEGYIRDWIANQKLSHNKWLKLISQMFFM